MKQYHLNDTEIPPQPMANASTLLLVDDNESNLKMLQSLFKVDYNLTIARSGLQALELINKGVDTPDLIILDVMMPELDGFETMEIISQHPLVKDKPVIFLTAKTDDVDRRRGLQLGASEYFSKPYVMEELKACVNKYLQSSLID